MGHTSFITLLDCPVTKAPRQTKNPPTKQDIPGNYISPPSTQGQKPDLNLGKVNPQSYMLHSHGAFPFCVTSCCLGGRGKKNTSHLNGTTLLTPPMSGHASS
jgi:hypothetical protein